MAEATPDLSEFEALSNPRKCKVCTAAVSLSPGERAQLAAACAAHRDAINAGAISAWFANRGLEVSITAITHHRKGTRSCD